MTNRSGSLPASTTVGSLDTLYEKGRQCVKDRDYVRAGRLFEHCLRIVQDYLPALIDLAFVLYTTSRIRAALTAYRKALKLSPKNPVILNGMGNCFRAEGEFQKAVTHYHRALSANPDNAVAIYNLTLLHSYGLDSTLVWELQRLYGSAGCCGQSRALVCFALARIHEGQRDLHRAFQYYSEADGVQFPLAGYDEARYAALFEDLEATFTSELFGRIGTAGREDEPPIFVIGMPRSGTSLVEQILASHAGVYGAGETSILPWMAESYIRETFGVPFPCAVLGMDAAAFSSLADVYLQHLAEYCPGRTERIVVKTPNNFFLVGLIRLMFPHAPIVHCVRDPMDTCWSLFRQYFGAAHGYCYNQLALERYYRRYRRLMYHWGKVLPGEIYDVRYETLVEHPERTIRGLLDYCRLSWDDKCLAYYRTKRVVNTASASQVRRPIYKTSIKSWLPVAEELAPLRAALEGRL